MSESTFALDSPFSTMDSMTLAPEPEIPRLTISPSDTTLKFEDVVPDADIESPKPQEKKPVKKRKSWGQELPTPKTNLPPRKRAKTEDEKEQRRIERVLRNRAAAQISRERKRLEIEKLEGEKLKIEQQNEFLLRRLSQMEVENNRLNQQVMKLSSEIQTSRGTTPQSVSNIPSPTLAPILFKQENDDLSADKVSFPTPSTTAYSPSVKAIDLDENSDLTQHPAEVLCDLQCQSEGPKDQKLSRNPSLTPHQLFVLLLQTIFQHVCLTMTSTVYSTVILPMSQIFHSLKEGSPLIFSPEEISQHLPLILWLISTPNLSTSKGSSQRSVFRIQLLTRLLECSPALARPLRDATSRELQLVASEMQSGSTRSMTRTFGSSRDWELLMTVIWAIDRFGKSHDNTKSSRMSRGGNKLRNDNLRAKRKLLRRSRGSRSSKGLMDF